MRVSAILVCGLLFLAGCNRATQCTNVFQKLCNKCDVDSDYESLTCKCLQKHKLTKSDSPEYFKDDAAAQRYCDSWLVEMQYPSPSAKMECVRDTRLIKKWEVTEYCEYFGWNDPAGDDDDDIFDTSDW